MAKILCFDFMPKDEDSDSISHLEVSFDAGEPQEAIKFLTAVSTFVASYNGDQGTQAKVVQLAPEPEPKPAPKPRASRSVTPPAPVTDPSLPKAQELPPVTEEVVAPIGSAQPAASTSAPVSSPSPAPEAPTPRAAVRQVPSPKATTAPVKTGQADALSAGSSAQPTPASAAPADHPPALPLDQVPADLASAKSFRAVLVLLQSEKHGSLRTVEQLVDACYAYANVPCVGRYLVPNPDPEQQIDVRIQRFLEATGAAA